MNPCNRNKYLIDKNTRIEYKPRQWKKEKRKVVVGSWGNKIHVLAMKPNTTLFL
jgi:hypothetical protein